jgi:SAM-dependent methyltransferase
MPATTNLRLSAPAVRRNRDPILDVLRTALPATGLVLEVASGTGEHIVHFARHMPNLEWQPSDPSAAARESIAAWVAAEGLANVLPPIDLEVAQRPWLVQQPAAIACINMVHISPWEATVGLMRGAGHILPSGGTLYLYGPFRRPGVPLEPSNEAFDQDLRARNPVWGLREIDAVIRCAAEHGLAFEQSVEMPANNLSLIFRKG